MKFKLLFGKARKNHNLNCKAHVYFQRIRVVNGARLSINLSDNQHNLYVTDYDIKLSTFSNFPAPGERPAQQPSQQPPSPTTQSPTSEPITMPSGGPPQQPSSQPSGGKCVSLTFLRQKGFLQISNQ